MDDSLPPFAVISDGSQKELSKPINTKSPEIPPHVAFDSKEKKVWAYICEQLKEAGLEHLTSGLAITVIVKTYRSWLDAEKMLADLVNDRGTYIVTTPNGHQQPHQIFYVARNLKVDLLKWLPECCLTIPSVATTRQKAGSAPPMDDLFEGLMSHAASHPNNENAQNLH